MARPLRIRLESEPSVPPILDLDEARNEPTTNSSSSLAGCSVFWMDPIQSRPVHAATFLQSLDDAGVQANDWRGVGL